MPLALGPALLIGGLASAGGGIAEGLLGSSAAKNAADTQASASEQAAQLNYQAEQNALAFQKQVFSTEQANQAPFLQAGQGAANRLSSQLNSRTTLDTTGALNSTGANEQWATPFNAPTAAQAEATPGYQFTLQQGLQALQRSAAAQGNLLTGGTLKDETGYAEGLAGTNYQQTYSNALQQYQQGYNVFQNNQANNFNRLSTLAGGGQTAAGQLNSAGGNAVNANASTLLGGAQAMGQAQQNAAAATASGYIGSANAWGNALGGATNSAQQAALLASLYGGKSGASGPVTSSPGWMGGRGL